MDINERKAQVKAIFRDAYNWWLANCDLDMTEQFFITAAREMVFQSTHPLRGATAKTYKENCTFFELADKLSARIAAKKPSAKADRCA